MKLPNFLVAGVPKAGTTNLWKNLRQHPDVFLPKVKEPRFFIDAPEGWVRSKQIGSLDSYRSLFEPATSEAAIGEVSPGYFSSRKAPDRIRETLGHPKIILVLRNPVERAFSHFVFSLRKGLEPDMATFESAIENETVRVGDSVRHRPYVNIGFYYQHLQRWTSIFNRNSIKLLFFEDLKDDEVAFTQRVYDFLGVDDSFEPDIGVKYAKSGIPRSRRLHSALTEAGRLRMRLKRWCPDWILDVLRDLFDPFRAKLKNWNLDKPELPDRQYRELAEQYRSDVHQLENETERNLSHWLEPSSRPQ